MHTHMCTGTDAELEERPLPVGSPLFLSQVLPACQAREHRDPVKNFSSMFQKGYEPTNEIIKKQVTDAIKSIFIEPQEEIKKGVRLVRTPKAMLAHAGKHKMGPAETDFQKWHRDAVAKYIDYEEEMARENVKNPKRKHTPLAPGPNANISAYLARPPHVEFFESSIRLNPHAVELAWTTDLNLKHLSGITTMGDGGRHQCVVTMDASESGVLSASCRVAIALSHAFCMCTPQHWPFPHTPHVACDCFCVGVQITRRVRTQMNCRCTRTSWTCLLTSWTKVFCSTKKCLQLVCIPLMIAIVKIGTKI
jgi:hypothetical protein